VAHAVRGEYRRIGEAEDASAALCDSFHEHAGRACHLDRAQGSNATEGEWRDRDDVCPTMLIQGVLPSRGPQHAQLSRAGLEGLSRNRFQKAGESNGERPGQDLPLSMGKKQFGENTSYRHGRGRILGISPLALSRSAPSCSVEMTDSGRVPTFANIEIWDLSPRFDEEGNISFLLQAGWRCKLSGENRRRPPRLLVGVSPTLCRCIAHTWKTYTGKTPSPRATSQSGSAAPVATQRASLSKRWRKARLDMQWGPRTSRRARLLLGLALFAVVAAVPPAHAGDKDKEDYDAYKLRFDLFWFYSKPTGSFTSKGNTGTLDLEKDIGFNSYSTFDPFLCDRERAGHVLLRLRQLCIFARHAGVEADEKPGGSRRLPAGIAIQHQH
jgi:hypothetical protein